MFISLKLFDLIPLKFDIMQIDERILDNKIGVDLTDDRRRAVTDYIQIARIMLDKNKYNWRKQGAVRVESVKLMF